MDLKYLWLFLLSSTEDHFYNTRYKNKNPYYAKLLPFLSWSRMWFTQYQTCRWSTPKTFCPRVLPPHALPHSSPQHSSTCIFHTPPGEREKKQNQNRTINGKAAGDRTLVCVQVQSTQHRDRGKAVSYLRAKGKSSLKNQLTCSYLIARAQESAFMPRLQTAQLHYPFHQRKLCSGRHTKHHLSFSILSWGRERTWSPSTSRYYYFCVRFDLPTWGYLQGWRTKQRWHSLPISVCFYVCLPGAVRNWKGFRSFKIPTIPSSQNI